MKPIIQYLSMILMITFIPLDMVAQDNSSNQQKNSPAGEIPGFWFVNFGRSVQSLGGQGKAKYDKMSERSKEHLKKSLENRSFEFNINNGVYIRFVANEIPQLVEGKWSYDQNNNSLTITSGSITMNYVVEWENRNNIRLVTKTSSNGLLDQFYLTRKN